MRSTSVRQTRGHADHDHHGPMNEIAIATSRLSKAYNGSLVLTDLSIEVASGEVFGLLGHNGAGKTTTVSILTTLAGPLGRQRRRERPRRRQGQPERAPRPSAICPRTCSSTMRSRSRRTWPSSPASPASRSPAARIREVLRFLDFEGHENERLSTFSKGMRQRVGIAQAILHEPSVSFLDEPTSGLDPAGVKMLRDTIVRLNRELGMTIFMNTHLLAEVTKTCTSIGILRAGRLIHHDSLEAHPAFVPGPGFSGGDLSAHRVGCRVSAVLTIARPGDQVGRPGTSRPCRCWWCSSAWRCVSSFIGWAIAPHRHERLQRDGDPDGPDCSQSFRESVAAGVIKNTVIYVVLIGALLATVVGVRAAVRDRKAGRDRPDLLAADRTRARTWRASCSACRLWMGYRARRRAASPVGSASGSSPGTRFRIAGTALLLGVLCAGLGVPAAVLGASGSIAGARSRHESTALLVPILVWVAVTFVIPQLGTAQNPSALLNPVARPRPRRICSSVSTTRCCSRSPSPSISSTRARRSCSYRDVTSTAWLGTSSPWARDRRPQPGRASLTARARP